MSKNALTSADALIHLRECAKLANLDLSFNDLDADDDNSVIAALAAVPSLVNLALKGNPVCRSTKNYRKTVVAALSRLTYLDERPVFGPERIATEAWKRGGIEAEREARVAHEKSLRDAQTESVEKFAAWSASVRAKRASELDSLNAERMARGEAPVTELPRKSFVSYTTASSKYVTESMLLQRISEQAEKAYAKGGSGILFEDTDIATTAAAAAANTTAARWTADGLVDEAGVIIERNAIEDGDETASSAVSTVAHAEKDEEAAENALLEDVYRRERELNDAARRSRAAADEAIAAGLQAGAHSAPPSSIIVDSLRIYNEREALRRASLEKDKGADDEDEDEETSRSALESDRRAIKLAEWAATAAKFSADQTSANGSRSLVVESSTVSSSRPTVNAKSEPRPTASSSAVLNEASPNETPLWFPALDAALLKFAGQAAFDFDKVSRGLQKATLRGHFASSSSQPSCLAALLTESACRVRYASLVTLKEAAVPLREALPSVAEPVATRAPRATSSQGDSSVRERLERWNAEKNNIAASAAASRMVSQIPREDFAAPLTTALSEQSAAVPSISPKPLSALLHGDFVLDTFRDYVATPNLPSLSREGLWATSSIEGADSDSDDNVPLDRVAIMSRFSSGAGTISLTTATNLDEVT